MTDTDDMTATRHAPQRSTGVVTSDKMTKTITVQVRADLQAPQVQEVRAQAHAATTRTTRRTQAKVGDAVEIVA